MNDQDDESGAVVIPLSGREVETSADDEALRLFAAGEGLLVRWSTADRQRRSGTWGPKVAATSSLAKGLNEVSKFQRVGSATKPLFTVELPPGQTIDNMVRAVGGGFRGLTREAGSSKITGQVRLQQVGGAGVSAGAGLALGPLVGLVALSVATEMIAQRQMDAKLKAIQGTVDAIHRHLMEQDEAVLGLADRTIRQTSAYLLDRVDIPTVAGADTIFGELAKFVEVRLNRLTRWESVADWAESRDKAKGGVDTAELLYKLADSDVDKTLKLRRNVEETYRALALQARVATLKRIEVAVRDPHAQLTHVESMVNAELAGIAENQERLTSVLGRFAGLRLSTGVFTKPGTERQAIEGRAAFGQLAYQLSVSPPAVPVLSSQHRPVVELERQSDGSFALLAPAAEARW